MKISKNRQNKGINRHIVNMIFLELKIVKMTINRQICLLWIPEKFDRFSDILTAYESS